jgi:hypothetical protein
MTTQWNCFDSLHPSTQEAETSDNTLTLNGRTATSTYTAATKTFSNQSPAGRQSTTTIDTQGRITREQVDSLEPVAFSTTRGADCIRDVGK